MTTPSTDPKPRSWWSSTLIWFAVFIAVSQVIDIMAFRVFKIDKLDEFSLAWWIYNIMNVLVAWKAANDVEKKWKRSKK